MRVSLSLDTSGHIMPGDGQSRKIIQPSRVSNRSFHTKPSSLPSVQVKYWKIAVGQGVKVPSQDVFASGTREMKHTAEYRKLVGSRVAETAAAAARISAEGIS